MTSGPHLTGKIDGDGEIIDREEVLVLLSEMARKGSVSAAIHLERALRLGKPDADIDEELARLLGDQ